MKMDISKVTAIEYLQKRQAILDSLMPGNKVGKGMGCADTHTASLETQMKSIAITMEYEIPIDWGNVPVDTKILVRDSDADEWEKKHFAKCDDGEVYAWLDGKTSFTAASPKACINWKFAKLYDEEDGI